MLIYIWMYIHQSFQAPDVRKTEALCNVEGTAYF
jgi:hypothetical protein